MASSSESGAARPSPKNTKAKRVRTGCLTCRARHLKCDETKPDCNNCIRGRRECKKGIRLNFIDIQTQHAHIIPLPRYGQIAFQDDSRDIANEYVGGAAMYSRPQYQDLSSDSPALQDFDTYEAQAQPEIHRGDAFFMGLQQPDLSRQPTALHPDLPYPEATESQRLLYHHQQLQAESSHRPPYHVHHNASDLDPVFSAAARSGGGMYSPVSEPPTSMENVLGMSRDELRTHLQTDEEVLYMSVFIQEVGPWMDGPSTHRHFSQLLPLHALNNNMLLNAFLACGARHISLISTEHSEDNARYYYRKANDALLDSVQRSDYDKVVCATTAVLLNVYDVMSDEELRRMNHLAGVRALVKECGRNARNPETFSLSREIDLRYHVIRERDQEGVLQIHRVDTKHNIADTSANFAEALLVRASDTA